MTNLPALQGKEILKQALESAKNRHNERYVKKVRDLVLAKTAFQNAIKEIDGIFKGLEENDALTYQKIDHIAKFCDRIKSVVFDRSYETSKYMPYLEEEDED